MIGSFVKRFMISRELVIRGKIVVFIKGKLIAVVENDDVAHHLTQKGYKDCFYIGDDQPRQSRFMKHV